MSEFNKLHEHLKECVDSDNDSFVGITEDGIEFNMFEWAFSLSLNAKKEVESILSDRQDAISLMSKSWQHDSENQDDLMTRYVTMAENQFEKKREEIERIAFLAAKHAARADELYEALESTNQELYFVINELNKYKTKDVRCDQLDPPDLHDMETCHLNAKLLDKSRTEADK